MVRSRSSWTVQVGSVHHGAMSARSQASTPRASVFSEVVVGLDGSDSALHALRWVAERIPPAGLHVVHAGAPDPMIPVDLSVGSVHSRDQAPGLALLAVASELDVDAVVIGPHGSGLVGRMGRGLGSVARELLSEATIPVLVIDGAENPRPLDGPVVACVGYGEPADTAATWAADYAVRRELPLVLLHSVAYRPLLGVDAPSEVLASYLGTGVSLEWAREELDEMASRLRTSHPTISISTHVEGTSVLKAVTRAGENSELVVLGKRSDDEFLSVIGTPRLRKLVARTRFPTAVIAVE